MHCDGNFIFRLVGADVSCEVLSPEVLSPRVPTRPALNARSECLACGLAVQVVAGEGVPWCCGRPMQAAEPVGLGVR